jgi:glycosyltransferase involved in cell wall biosynthesis
VTQSKLRVLHLLWGGSLGGAERAVYQVVREEVRRGEWDVAVAFGRAEGPWISDFEALGCEVINLAMRNTVDLPRALKGVSRLREFDVHHFQVLELAMLAASARCHTATRVFTQRHGEHTTGEPTRKRVRRLLGGRMLRAYMHAVAGNTAHATNYAVTRYGLDHIPSDVTYNGIDFSLLAPVRDSAQVRAELGLAPGSFLVGSSGVFKGWKRFERVVALLGEPRETHVLLVGDGSRRRAFETEARTLGAGDRLHVTGLVGNVADYLQIMDVFVLPSSAEESFGNAVVEAMALGIPSVVFSDSPGICEHIENGVTGFVVENQDDLVSVTRQLAANPALRRQVGEAAAIHVRSKYTLDKMHESYARLYEAAMTNRRSRDVARRKI